MVGGLCARGARAHALRFCLLALALAGPLAAAPIAGGEPPAAVLAAMEARLEKAFAAQVETRVGEGLREREARIGALEAQLAQHAQQLHSLAATSEQQQARLDRCAAWTGTGTPESAEGDEPLAAHTTTLGGQEGAAAGRAAQQAQIDALRAQVDAQQARIAAQEAREDERRRLQAEGPPPGDLASCYAHTVFRHTALHTITRQSTIIRQRK
jgi:septal ring factor EnvC (AmiA/AmiB activator)